MKKAPASMYSPEDLTPKTPKDARVQGMQPVIMDQTVREPATYTPFGHTGYMKFLSLQIVRAMGFKDIAITGQYYKDSYTPETQILEEMQRRNESMAGTIAMFAPGGEDRKAGIAAIKDFKIPNAFLDTTMKSSVRFADANFVTSVLEAVEELDGIFRKMGLPDKPWRDDTEINSRPGAGEVSLNLVDLMEFLDLQNDGSMSEEKRAQAEHAFATWKDNPVFRRRVVAILTEDGCEWNFRVKTKVSEVRYRNVQLEHGKRYRLSPLVSDAETWRKRIAEAEILTAQDEITIGDIYQHVRDLGFALMNANIRVNLDEKDGMRQWIV
eukprot:Skav213090  [mRNA]  locus=scaffold512:59983:62126:- [translate_table: standard]